MTEKKLNIVMADGTAEAHLFLPDDGGNNRAGWPGIIFLTDIFGIRPANIGMAKRLCAEGYAVLMPNVFYRSGTDAVFELPLDTKNPETQRKLQVLLKSLDAQQMGKDMHHYAEFLRAQSGVAAGHLGAVGYCFTGQMALLGAAAAPDEIGAVASFHGGGLYTDKPESPHSFLPRVKAKLYFGHAKDDNSMNAEQIAKFEDALKKWAAQGGVFESKTYEGHHGWTVPDKEAYNEPEAEKAYAALVKTMKHTAGA